MWICLCYLFNCSFIWFLFSFPSMLRFACLLLYLFFHFICIISFSFYGKVFFFIFTFLLFPSYFCFFYLVHPFLPFSQKLDFFLLSLPYLSRCFFHCNLSSFLSFFVVDLPSASCFISSWRTQHLSGKITNTSHVCLWVSFELWASSLSYIYLCFQCITSVNNQNLTTGTPFRS